MHVLSRARPSLPACSHRRLSGFVGPNPASLQPFCPITSMDLRNPGQSGEGVGWAGTEWGFMR